MLLAVGLSSFSHEEVGRSLSLTSLDWPYDLLWPVERGESDNVPVQA